jgi:DNA polymerase-3 subunit beta
MATLTATDRYRIAVMSIPYKPLGEDHLPAPLLIPARDLAAVVKKPAAATVTLGLSLPDTSEKRAGNPGTAAFTMGGRQVTMRLLEGEFPDFTRFITPGAAKATVTAEATALSAAVKRAAVVAERNTPVRLTPGDGSLHIEAGTGDEAGYAEDIPVELDGDPIPIAFNPAYLLDALAAVTATGSTRARIQMTDSFRPALIQPDPPPDGSVCVHVLMPIKAAG